MIDRIIRQPWTPPEIDELLYEGNLKTLRKLCQDLQLDPLSIDLALDLGPGTGRWTKALLNLSQRLTVHTVDIYNDFDPSASLSSRVIFHPGTFLDVLKKNSIPPVDIALMISTGGSSGFTQDNIYLLQRAIRHTGYLVTGGENGGWSAVEREPWFSNFFKNIRGNPWHDKNLYIWQPKPSK